MLSWAKKNCSRMQTTFFLLVYAVGNEWRQHIDQNRTTNCAVGCDFVSSKLDNRISPSVHQLFHLPLSLAIPWGLNSHWLTVSNLIIWWHASIKDHWFLIRLFSTRSTKVIVGLPNLFLDVIHFVCSIPDRRVEYRYAHFTSLAL